MPMYKRAADALVSSGMRDAGYVYVNIDDTWEGQAGCAGQYPHQQQISGHEGAGRLCPLEGAEARHLFFAGAEDLRGLSRAAMDTRRRTRRRMRRGESII